MDPNTTMSDKLTERLQSELASFQTIWKGGYFEGPVLSELQFSGGYGSCGYMSVVYATYLKCIKPYINSESVVLEIGPGRGTWTKTMLGAKKVVVMDALSAEHNDFWRFVGDRPNVEYIEVKDFSCDQLPDNFFNYVFSFGCLCHISFDGIAEYATNLFPKLRSGCNCFWMIADYDKANTIPMREGDLDIYLHLLERKKVLFPLYVIYKSLFKRTKPTYDKNEDDTPRPARWYHAGLDRCCEMLESKGYRIIERDTGTLHRDPIIHFTKD